MMEISEITLGTVQLGKDYGIANKTGKPTREAANEILKVAYDKWNTFIRYSQRIW